MTLHSYETATLRAAMATELYFRDARRDTFALRIHAVTVDVWIGAVAYGGYDVTRLIDRHGYRAVHAAVRAALRAYANGDLNAH